MKNHSRTLLTVIIGAALIAAPIVSAAQTVSNYELLQQIRNLQQEVAELRDRIDRQEYAAQQNNRQANSQTQQTSSTTVFPSPTQTGSQTSFPSYPSTVQTPVQQPNQSQSPRFEQQASAPQIVDRTNGGPLIEERDLSGAVPLGQQSTPSSASTTNKTSNQAAPVDSVNTNLRVEDRVISPEKTAPVTQARPSSSVANPQADLLQRGDKAIQTSLQEEDLYARGLDQLKQQQYEQAVSLFNAQLQAYPRGQRSADAYYWIGESLYILENLDSSKKSYQSILTLFPSSRRVPNALFKVAKIENEQGNQTLAKATLQSLLARYPSSSAAAQAKATLAELL